MERTKKYSIWFQAAGELKRKENINRDTSYSVPLAIKLTYPGEKCYAKMAYCQNKEFRKEGL